MTASDHANTVRERFRLLTGLDWDDDTEVALDALEAQAKKADVLRERWDQETDRAIAAERRAADLERALWVMGNESYPAAIQRAKREKFRADHYADQMNVQRQRAEAAEGKNKKLSALIMEQEKQYRAERKAAEADHHRLQEELSRYQGIAAEAEAERDRLADTLREAEAVLIEINSKPYRAEEATVNYFERRRLAALARTEDTP